MIAGQFLILALPRSRTFWLSHLLSCAHDPSAAFESKADIGPFFASASAVDTGLTMIWREVANRAPELRICTVRRPLKDVVESVKAYAGLDIPEALRVLDSRLNEVEAYLQCPSFSYASLDRLEGCAALYEYCLGTPMPPTLYLSLRPRNLQIPAATALTTLSSRASALQKVFS